MNTNRSSKYFSFIRTFVPSIDESRISLYFEGGIDYYITRSLTDIAEHVLQSEKEPRIVQKRVFNIMVECLQNIARHADTEDHLKTIKQGNICLINYNTHYLVIAGNAVENMKIPAIKKSIFNIESKSFDQLRRLYIRQLKEGVLSDKGGAGLGFIDMARKSRNPVSHTFYPINTQYSFFMVKFMIHKK